MGRVIRRIAAVLVGVWALAGLQTAAAQSPAAVRKQAAKPAVQAKRNTVVTRLW